MQAAPKPFPSSRRLHRKSLAALRRIADLLERCEEKQSSGKLLLEINLNRGVPSRMAQLEESPKRDIPLEDAG